MLSCRRRQITFEDFSLHSQTKFVCAGQVPFHAPSVSPCYHNQYSCTSPAIYMTWHSPSLTQAHRPYSQMAAALFSFCCCANQPTKPHLRASIFVNLAHSNEAWQANLHKNKRIMNWQPFMNKVYNYDVDVPKVKERNRNVRFFFSNLSSTL